MAIKKKKIRKEKMAVEYEEEKGRHRWWCAAPTPEVGNFWAMDKLILYFISILFLMGPNLTQQLLQSIIIFLSFSSRPRYKYIYMVKKGKNKVKNKIVLKQGTLHFSNIYK